MRCGPPSRDSRSAIDVYNLQTRYHGRERLARAPRTHCTSNRGREAMSSDLHKHAEPQPKGSEVAKSLIIPPVAWTVEELHRLDSDLRIAVDLAQNKNWSQIAWRTR